MNSIDEHLSSSIFWVGVITIVIAITLSIVLKNPSTTQLWMFRVIMSLGAACFTTIIPGTISIDWLNVGIRAAGAIGIFVIVYLLDPPSKLKNNRL